jgi:apolipoprotein N-acyltransferase
MPLKYPVFYPFISGFLLCLPWLGTYYGFVLLFAFVPLLFWEQTQDKDSAKTFLYASLTFLTWNAGTTWWIGVASVAGAVSALFINTTLFSLVFWLYHIVRKSLGNFLGSLAFVILWTSFEYFYLNTEISWPWLNLGNALRTRFISSNGTNIRVHSEEQFGY